MQSQPTQSQTATSQNAQSQPAQTAQTAQPHITALREKHAWLERRLAEAIRRPAPDEELIRDLKRRKLRLKDELAHA